MEMKNKETVVGRKCKNCGKALPKLHLPDLCIVCEHEEQMMDDEEPTDSFEQFKKVKKGWK